MMTAYLRVFRPLLLVVLLTAALVLALATAGQAQSPAGRGAPAPISPYLYAQLARAADPVSFLIILDDQLDPQAVTGAVPGDATARRTALYHALTAHAAKTQAPLRAWLDTQGIAYQPFYLTNMIAVAGDLTLAQQLAQQPGVNRLSANPAVRQADAVVPAHIAWLRLPLRWAMTADAAQAMPYGLHNTQADQVWALGYRGAGIVVGSQDTGVDWDHPALQEAYRGWNAVSGTADHVYNWLDAFGRDADDQMLGCPADPQVPCDYQGHGTHTVGTMVGDATAMSNTIIGMAPDAQWIGCRNMDGIQGVGTPASYTTCFEFLLAPYPQGGNPAVDGQPALGAHVVNNSWGCPPDEGCDVDTLRAIVETVRSAGIVVVASAGNAGSGCRTVRNPIGLYDASLTVGAVDSADAAAGFSSRGPVTADGSGRRKPDIAAPGVSVRSAGLGGAVNVFASGTSMAAPHVAGAVALLWSAAPALVGDVDLTEQILLRSATPNPTTSECDGGGAVWPNNVTGYGSLNVLAAVLTAQQPATVTLAFVAGGQPVTVTQAALVDPATGYRFPAAVLAGHRAAWPQVYAGQYRIEALDSSGVALRITGDLAVARGVTVAETLTVIPVRAFMPLLFR